MADSNIGQQMGKYRLIRQLGHGGFADVYLGEHIYLKTEAAIKVLHTQLQHEDIEKFRSEALTIAHLMHPHIVRVLDFDVENSVPFLVMDYAPNGTLRHRHPKGTQIPPAIFMPYVKQIASALQYAHDQKLIHRDVKPENMLLGRNDEVLLSDFGIALVSQSTLSQNTEDLVIGTMAYMAPEQIQGRPRPASDQYALGVVVYEWLCGMKPFNGSYVEIVTQHLSAPPPPLNEQVLAIPHAVQQVLFKALAKDPHQRFARVQDFADALEQAYQSKGQPLMAQH
ncbi:MAG: serine/threonine protein kinase, partial [Chloroflexota bacterium]|nr:serine/threonine protein kinase [Chloroflexota bacterium]